ncbi:MAG: DoxX family protein [Pseudomonadota bacterium]
MIDLKTAPYAAFLLRVASGLLFVAHGLTKVFVFTIPGTVGFFESLGFPAALAYLTIAAELGGGLALIFGIGTRVVALALLPVLLGATYVHLGNGWSFTNEGGGWEFPAFWAATLGVNALLGSGAHAVKLPKAFGTPTTA